MGRKDSVRGTISARDAGNLSGQLTRSRVITCGGWKIMPRAGRII